MNKELYLKELSKNLSSLSKADYEDTTNYFREYFDEVGVDGEEALIAELGSPKNAAEEILSKLSAENVNDERRERKSFFDFKNKSTIEIVFIILGCIFLFPIVFPLGISLIAVVFSIILILFLLCFSFGIVGVVGLFVTFKLILLSVVWIFTSSFFAGLILLGCGFVVMGLSILFFLVCVYGVKSSILVVRKIIELFNRKRRDF